MCDTILSRLTFWGQSQTLPCCTCGSSHQAFWWQCSWTSWQSWRCRLCRASPLGSGFLLAGNLASGPGPIPAGRTLSCCPPVSADRLPYLEAGGKQRERDFQMFNFSSVFSLIFVAVQWNMCLFSNQGCAFFT